ncbi:MAG: hypothetical protein H7X91_10360 [Burkholderiales bacterium]|nr:hypothetical protein [Burkholderiales bacterium]
MVVSSLIALFIGGWVVSHLAGIPRQIDGMLHGLLTWGLSTLVILYPLGTAIGSVLGGAFNLAGGVVSGAAKSVACRRKRRPKPSTTGCGPKQQAQAKFQDVKTDVKQDARAIANQTAEAVSKGALWGSFALLLGAIAAAIGGAMDRPRTVIA